MTITRELHYGRRKPKNTPAIPLRAILRTTQVPVHPAAQDNLARLTAWKMLGNDQAGDCVSVTWANARRLVTALLAGREEYPSQDQVWQLYKTQNPNFDPNSSTNGGGSSADGGMDIQTVLEYLSKTGGPDGVKIAAFAKVDHTNPDEVKAAIAIFGYVWIGINVTAANESQFPKQAWDYVPGSQMMGGHSVLAGGYLGKTTEDETFITWAQEQDFTDNFWSHQVEEAWVAIWPEHLGSQSFLEGVNEQALVAAYEQITGRSFPVVTPPPVPAPTPQPPAPPAPVPGTDGVTINITDSGLVTHLKRVSRTVGLDAWATKHFHSYFRG